MNTKQRGTIPLRLSPEAIRYLAQLVDVDAGQNTTEAIAYEVGLQLDAAEAAMDIANSAVTATYADVQTYTSPSGRQVTVPEDES